MSIKIEGLDTKEAFINFRNLPADAIDELYFFCEYLTHKYGRKKKRAIKRDVVKNIEKLSWEMREKLYKNRDELYER